MQRVLELLAGALFLIEHVEEPTRVMREARCEDCDFRDKQENRCKVCKCFLAVKQKSKENRNPQRLRNEVTHCPHGKWNDKDIANEYRQIDGLPLLP